MTVSITNDRGVEVSRQIVGVGAIPPGEQRKFTVAVEVFSPAAAPDAETGDTSAAPPQGRVQQPTFRGR